MPFELRSIEFCTNLDRSLSGFLKSRRRRRTRTLQPRGISVRASAIEMTELAVGVSPR